MNLKLIMFSQKLTTLSEEEFRRKRYQAGYLNTIRFEHYLITSQPQIGSFEHFSKQENEKKNRYPDIICWDASRVKITQKNCDTDYIHANFVDHYETSRKFIIATQGPLKETIDQFWQMAWEQNSRIIIMLTKFQVAGEEKCAKYWNADNPQVKFQAGELSIKIVDVTQSSDYITTIFEVFNCTTEESRLIMHYQYLDWPDQKVPPKCESLMKLIIDMTEEHQKILRKATNAPTGPVIVHCSAGIGRTGSFCATNLCITQLAKTGKISVPEIVMQVRKQRRSSVFAVEQYVFIYTVLYEFLRLFDMYPEVKQLFCES
ncbi:tyrosine-protein phosphatase non-receptor type 9-like [Cydia pomonella]|uniref:tyrosine-protein phosphatase non-receptor type 9-like n=1 Tax=Cydia pomonella TaxID=82600 RepID=UPI002ADDFE03|nr:tyrosine-protein phosphatase non-receptor type 9-like [Cydia pomonella]XP_061729062.1 tyrosine-protein phosphatase non-receptor type 9-like [Cydia pomonella]